MDYLINKCGKSRRRQSGFTLLELLVTLALVIILASLATPSFYPLLQSYRLADTSNLLQRALRHAREQAILRNKTTRICPSSNGDYCSTNTPWSAGFISFVDSSNDHQRQDNEPLIEAGSINPAVSVYFNRSGPISFNRLGRASINGTIRICDPVHRVNSEQLILIHSGRVRKSAGNRIC